MLDAMELVETPVFTRQVSSEFSEDEYRLLQLHLIQRPDAGDTIPGSGGLRKLRWRLPSRGKRGGARVIYFWKRKAEEVDRGRGLVRIGWRYRCARSSSISW